MNSINSVGSNLNFRSNFSVPKNAFKTIDKNQFNAAMSRIKNSKAKDTAILNKTIANFNKTSFSKFINKFINKIAK